MSSGEATPQPTFHGYVATTQDALILFEACLQGIFRIGCVFIYEENTSGIKRWTDGVTWSPSRILGNFLVYRELDKPFPPGEKNRAMKKQANRPSRPGEPYARSSDVGSYSDGQSTNFPMDRSASAEVERQLIGSLVDSYGFKPEGLVKKTMSVTVQGLRTPEQTDNLQYIRPRAELTQKQSFRAPIEEVDDVEGTQNAYAYRMNAAGYAPPPYYIPQSHPPMAQQSNPPRYPMDVPVMSAPYMQPPVTAPHLQWQRNDYSQYDQSRDEGLAKPQQQLPTIRAH